MDEIQRTLIKAGRKDLAQKYYHKIIAEKIKIKGMEFTVGPDAIVDKKGNVYGWDIIKEFYKVGKKKGYV